MRVNKLHTSRIQSRARAYALCNASVTTYFYWLEHEALRRFAARVNIIGNRHLGQRNSNWQRQQQSESWLLRSILRIVYTTTVKRRRLPKTWFYDIVSNQTIESILPMLRCSMNGIDDEMDGREGGVVIVVWLRAQGFNTEEFYESIAGPWFSIILDPGRAWFLAINLRRPAGNG